MGDQAGGTGGRRGIIGWPARIRASQERYWRELCEVVDAGPRGLPYRIMARKLGGQAVGLATRGQEWAVANALFPATDAPTSGATADRRQSPDLQPGKATGGLPNGRSPGPEGVLNDALTRASRLAPDALLCMFNICLGNAAFPRRWKRARLALLHKSTNKPVTEPASFRPLCMLKTAGKLFERLVLNWLEQCLVSTGGISGKVMYASSI